MPQPIRIAVLMFSHETVTFLPNDTTYDDFVYPGLLAEGGALLWTILLVEPVQPFLGTIRLDALPYKNVDVRKFYPYGDPRFP
jgi:hypothetical protein